jgi:phage tail sheath protein FI
VQQWFRIQVLYYRDQIPNPLFDPNDATKFARTPEVLEDFDNLTHISTESNFAQTLVNGASHLIQVTACPGPPDAPPSPPSQITLTNGTTVDAVEADYLDEATTDPEQMKGLEGICQLRDVSLVAIPDAVLAAHPNLNGKIIDKCEGMRDRFGILSADDGPKDFGTFRPPRDTNYAAFYYPWVRVSAPHTPLGHRTVPPTGHITGLYARVDVDRGVHKAPANEVIRGIISRDLLPDFKPLGFTLNKRQHDMLNPRGVNVIRDFRPDGRDIRVWGARTMTSDAMWKYVNVRRLFIFVEQSIDRGTQWAVFEPNSDPTWSAIRTAIRGFLRTVWRNGALLGTTQDEAFFVKCDRTTMTQDDLDGGRLICLIGIAPVKPAEFVIFRISQKTMEAES